MSTRNGWGPSHDARVSVGLDPSEVQWPIPPPGGATIPSYEPPSETDWTLVALGGVAVVLAIVLFRGVVR